MPGSKQVRSSSRGKIAPELKPRVFTPLANASGSMKQKFDYTRKSNEAATRRAASKKQSRASRMPQVAASMKARSNSIISGENADSLNLPNRDMSNRQIGLKAGDEVEVEPESKEEELKPGKERTSSAAHRKANTVFIKSNGKTETLEPDNNYAEEAPQAHAQLDSAANRNMQDSSLMESELNHQKPQQTSFMNSDQAYVDKPLGSGLTQEFHSLDIYQPDLTPLKSTIKVGTILQGMRARQGPNELADSPIYSRGPGDGEAGQGALVIDEDNDEYNECRPVDLQVQWPNQPQVDVLTGTSSSKRDFGQQVASDEPSSVTQTQNLQTVYQATGVQRRGEYVSSLPTEVDQHGHNSSQSHHWLLVMRQDGIESLKMTANSEAKDYESVRSLYPDIEESGRKRTDFEWSHQHIEIQSR